MSTDFLSQVSILIRFWTDWHTGAWLGFWMGETCWGLNTRYEAHSLIFLTPTQTHVSDAHRHSYGRFGSATCGVSGLLKNRVIERVGAFGTVTDSGKIMTF
jgi:hypothetical protein